MPVVQVAAANKRPAARLRVGVEDRVAGRADAELVREVLADGREGWPPPWPPSEDELEGLGQIVRLLALDAEEYRQAIRFTEHLLDRSDVCRLRAALASALERVPRIHEPEIRALAEAVGFPVPKLEGAPCS